MQTPCKNCEKLQTEYNRCLYVANGIAVALEKSAQTIVDLRKIINVDMKSLVETMQREIDTLKAQKEKIKILYMRLLKQATEFSFN